MSESWQLLATRPGGTVAALAVADEGRLLFAATAAGLRISSNGGRSWNTAGALGLTPPVEAVAPSPTFGRDRTVFIGTADGLCRSTDGGQSWQLVLAGDRVLSLAVSPSYAEDGLLFAGTENDGILRSEDGGRSWASANPGLLDLTVIALALSPRFGQDRTGFAATASGLYRTRNGGKAWRALELPLEEVAVQCLAVSPAFDEDLLVLAGTEADGLLRSTDGGTSWELPSALARQPVTALAFAPRQLGRLVAAATAQGIMLSDDGGERWRPLVSGLGPVLSLAFVPGEQGATLVAGLARRGAVRIDPASGRWTPAEEGLRASLIVALRALPSQGPEPLLLTAGLEEGVAVSEDGGQSWREANDGLPEATVFDLAPAPRFPAEPALFAATAAGLYRSDDGARSWHPAWAVDPRGAARALAAGRADDAGAPLLAALQDGGLLLSEDGGASWRLLPWRPERAEVLSLACSPRFGRDRTLYVGTGAPDEAAPGVSDLVLWRSADGGSTWQRWLVTRGPKALPLLAREDSILVGVDGRVLRPRHDAQEVVRGERRPLWRGADLPGVAAVSTALASTRDDAGHALVLAATSGGVACSWDGGASFAAWSEGLPPGPIVSLAVAPESGGERCVYAVGLGGSIWRRRVGSGHAR